VLLVFVAVRKALDYAADPRGEKDCPPLAPVASDPAGLARTPLDAPAALVWVQRGGMVNDASCLSRTPVYGVVAVREIDDIRAALQVVGRMGAPRGPPPHRTSAQAESASGRARRPRSCAFGSFAVPATTRPMMPWAIAASRNMANARQNSQSEIAPRPARRQ